MKMNKTTTRSKPPPEKRRWGFRSGAKPREFLSSDCFCCVTLPNSTLAENLDKEMALTMNTKTSQQSASRIRKIESVQCRAWVWRYKMDNRTHHHLGYNLFLKGEAGERQGRFILAISDIQHTKLKFRIGDMFKGTA
jgi:hypothetical protein